MYSSDKIKEIHFDNSMVFDFILDDEFPKTIDYCDLNQELIFINDNELRPGGIKKKNEIKTIDELRSIMKKLILVARQSSYQSMWDKIADSTEEQELRQTLDGFFKIKEQDMDLLVNQLVFDVLFYNYTQEDFKNEMKLPEYCDKYFPYNIGEKWVRATAVQSDFQLDKVAAKNTAINTIDRQSERFARVLTKKEYAEAYKELGFDANDIEHCATAHDRPRIIWDYFFYSSNKDMITSRQYRRNFVMERKGDYIKLADELNNYDKYVEALMLEREGGNTPEEYFRKCMDYYILESQSKIDVMYKIAEILEEYGFEKASKGNRVALLLDKSYINVACPYIQQATEDSIELRFKVKQNRYLPITLIEKSCGQKLSDLLTESEFSPLWDVPMIDQYRAKAYELFKYHYVYVNDGYTDIANFLRCHYDILSFHEKNKMWKHIEKKGLTQAQKTRLENIQIINNYLFPEFGDWSRAGWKKSNKNKAAPTISKQYTKIDETKLTTLDDEDYCSLLGMDKATFGTMLHTLDGAFKSLHVSGGRPTRLSVLDKLIITIEYIRNRYTMESIAAEYGVSKSRISDAIKWVKKTLADNGISLDQVLSSK